MTPEMIRAEYPEILSSEQIRQILGISKRKASWMLNNGHIPCQITDQPTHRYRILREDLIAYLNDREKHPEKYMVPKGAFSTAKTAQQKEEGFPMVLPQDFREWLEDEWCNLPDVLTADKIEKRTGYTKKTILRWMRTKRLKCVVIPHDLVTTKEWLVEFYCCAGYEPRYMCEKHKKLVRRYLKEH